MSRSWSLRRRRYCVLCLRCERGGGSDAGQHRLRRHGLRPARLCPRDRVRSRASIYGSPRRPFRARPATARVSSTLMLSRSSYRPARRQLRAGLGIVFRWIYREVCPRAAPSATSTHLLHRVFGDRMIRAETRPSMNCGGRNRASAATTPREKRARGTLLETRLTQYSSLSCRSCERSSASRAAAVGA